MKASEVIKALNKRIDLFGDWNVAFRDADNLLEPDIDILSIFGDEESERIVMSNMIDLIEED